VLVENAATNLALHSRDLTNAVWSGTTVTTAKNAVGADGTASGATTITATAASGTVLQALSHASQSRVFSAYIRRVTGTGAIQLTTNGGTNWTTVTITSGYTQVACAAQTVLNGSVGIRMAVSGDVIEVDFTQGEVGPVATSPMATTTGSVTRNADVISLLGAVSGCIGQTQGTIYVEFIPPSGSTDRIFAIDDGTVNNRIAISRATSTRLEVIVRSSGSVANGSITSSAATAFNPNAPNKVAYAYKSGDFALAINGSVVASGTTAFAFTSALNNLGTTESSLGAIYIDRIRSVALYTTRLTNAELAALTTL
jgi:hypothetical protein